MAAPAAAVAATKSVGAEAAGVIRSVLNALDKPIWTNVRTETVTHVAENGDVIVRTRTHGWTVPLGLVVAGIAAALLWEVGQMFATAVNKSGAAIPNFLTGATLAFGELGNTIGLSSGPGLAWDYLDGRGAVNQGPPSGTVKTVTMPGSAMAAWNQLLANAIGTISVPVSTAAPTLLSKLLPSGNG